METRMTGMHLVFVKVDESLQDIRSGNLLDFTRPTTILPDRRPFPNL